MMKLRDLKREKVFVILRNLVITEALVYFIFMVLALTADWGKIYEEWFWARYIRFEIIEFSLLGLSQLALIILVFTRSMSTENDINEILKSGEHNKLEFKTSLRWDTKRGHVNKDLEKAVMKTVVAFLNSEGGQIILGANDQGELIGLEQDLSSLPKPNPDGFENHFNNIFNIMVGPEFRRLVKLKFNNINDKKTCLINVEPSRKPVYLKIDDNEDFYIRTGNTTTPLKMSEVATYISSWWRK